MVVVYAMLLLDFDAFRSTIWKGGISLLCSMGLFPWFLCLLSIHCYRNTIKTNKSDLVDVSISVKSKCDLDIQGALDQLRSVTNNVDNALLKDLLLSLEYQLVAKQTNKVDQYPGESLLLPSTLSVISLGLYLLADLLRHPLLPEASPVPSSILAIGSLFMLSGALFTHYFGGVVRYPNYKMWQPFRGGYTFVVLQGLGWTLVTACLILSLIVFFAVPSAVANGLVSFIGISGCVGHVILFVSLTHYQDVSPNVDTDANNGLFIRHANRIVGLLLTATAVFLYAAGEMVFNQYGHMIPVAPITILASLMGCAAVHLAYYSEVISVGVDKNKLKQTSDVEEELEWGLWDAAAMAIPLLTVVVAVSSIYWTVQQVRPIAGLYNYSAVLVFVAIIPLIIRMFSIEASTWSEWIYVLYLEFMSMIITTYCFMLPWVATATVFIVAPAWGTLGSYYWGYALAFHTFTWLGIHITRLAGRCLVVYAIWNINYDCLIWSLITLWYLSYYNNDHIDGKRRVQRWKDGTFVYDMLAKYFQYTLIPKGKLSPDKKYIACFHPHGVFAMSCVWATLCKIWKERYGNVQFIPHVATILLRTPAVRDTLMLMGIKDVSGPSLHYSLENGILPLLVPGGQAEMMYSDSRSNKQIIVAFHKGFIRLALTYGADLVPMYCFGETQVLDIVRVTPIQQWFRKKMKFAYPHVPYGRWYMPLPNRVPVTLVVGDPIPVPHIPNPTKEDVDQLHKKYFDTVRELFESHKASCGFADAELIIKW
eukprot:NODE_547_length_2609_cov_42.572405_g470_i0.p1 GENE.NODE_547_length_2609_cov_42.572405_g470_i0~~NODE_547_length_2609_cov_42.572405_g470_i0.p1  ORF type:complete len:832 (+),score=161.02 NODE_547_length_2609_cov_42.572405_g470_i0:208-2496(+)